MTINFRPIISFTKNGTSENNNIIDALSSIMYFLFTECPGYNPRFYYDENNFFDSIGILYPYYIITAKHLILLDVNLTNAQFIIDPCIIDVFREKFEEAYSNTKPLTKKYDKMVNVTDLFLSKTKSRTTEWLTCCSASGGCLEKFADEAMTSKYLNQNAEDIARVVRYMQEIKINEKSTQYMEFQTINAITEFAETGEFTQIKRVLKSDISPEDRKTILSLALENQHEMGNIIDNTKVKMPPICLMAIKNDCVILYMDIVSDMLIISEPEIANAFYDFFYSLLETESIIISPMAVNDLLKNALKTCDEQIEKSKLSI